jgi:hypothetical protein
MGRLGDEGVVAQRSWGRRTEKAKMHLGAGSERVVSMIGARSNHTGSRNRKISVQVTKQDPISKITYAKRAGGMVQVVEHLRSKCEA